MRVILHIGIEKTGTTSIQNFLNNNSGILKKKGYITIPGLQKNFNCIEYVLASSPEPGGDLSRLRHTAFEPFRNEVKNQTKRIIDNSNKNDSLILSSEHFSSRLNNIESISLLKSLFPDDTSFEVVVYLKRQDKLFLGELSESLKAGADYYSASNPLITLTRSRYGNDYYNFYNLLENWSNVFGKNAINANIFESNEIQGDVVKHFLEAIEINELNNFKFSKDKKNQSLPAEALYLFKELMLECGTTKDRTVEILSKIDWLEERQLVEEEALKNFMEMFSDSNEAIKEKYFNGKEIFKEKRSHLPAVEIKNKTKMDEIRKNIIQYINKETS